VIALIVIINGFKFVGYDAACGCCLVVGSIAMAVRCDAIAECDGRGDCWCHELHCNLVRSGYLLVMGQAVAKR